MYLNGFSVKIPGCKELPGGYVEIEHDTKYKLALKNSLEDLRCDAHVEIDGKHVGTWRINADSSLLLERPAHDKGCFTAYLRDSDEGIASDLHYVDRVNLGLIKVTFTPEKQAFRDASTVLMEEPVTRSFGRKAVGTGLSGSSDQKFGLAQSMQLDSSRQTVIHLRLVEKLSSDNMPRPLTSFSTPIPPPIYR